MINPSEFTRRGTFKNFDYTQEDSGGTTPSLDESITVWCKVEDLSGSTNPTQGQVRSNADFRVTARYNSSITTDWVFTYEGTNMKVRNIEVDDEGYKRFMIVLCTK